MSSHIEENKPLCYWNSNIIFTGYNNIDFDQANELEEVKEILKVC